MRLVVFFDLPTETSQQKKAYRQFRKFLIKDGYLMLQYSVYSKMVLDGQAAEAAIGRMQKNHPQSGVVQVLKVTEKQYSGIVQICGESRTNQVVDSVASLIVL